MGRNHFPIDRIFELHDAAIRHHLAAHQEKLLEGLSPSFIAGLPDGDAPNGRLLTTLHRLNERPALSDGSVPFVVWLRNAHQRTNDPVFAKALAELGHPLPAPAPRVAPAGPAPAVMASPNPSLPDKLVQALSPLKKLLHAGPNTVLPLVGSGLSRGLPSWTKLLESLIAEVRHDDEREELTKALAKDKYLEVASQLERSLHRGKVSAAIEAAYKRPSLPRPREIDLVASLPTTQVATTNYDPWLKDALAKRLGEAPRVYAPHDPWAFGDLSPVSAPLVLMLHGDADRAGTCVLSEDGYRDLVHFPAYRNGVRTLFGSRSLLFIGHSLTDPDLRAVLDEWQAVMGNGGAPRHYYLGGCSRVG